jgi:hypothetical protein
MFLDYNYKLDIQHNMSNIIDKNSYNSNSNYFLDMSLLSIFILMVSIFTCKQICNFYKNFYKSSNNQFYDNEFNEFNDSEYDNNENENENENEVIENNLQERFLSNTRVNEDKDQYISYNDVESGHDKEIDNELPSYSEINN